MIFFTRPERPYLLVQYICLELKIKHEIHLIRSPTYVIICDGHNFLAENLAGLSSPVSHGIFHRWWSLGRMTSWQADRMGTSDGLSNTKCSNRGVGVQINEFQVLYKI